MTDQGTADVVGDGYARQDAVGALALMGLEDLRCRRRRAQEDEADLSYLRRLLQGRVDILCAELARRSGRRAAPDTLLEQLPVILADVPSQVRSSARHVTLGTPRSAEFQSLADEIMDDIDCADPEARSDAALQAACIRLTTHERAISQRRQRLQRIVDECSAEITRRYREGEARVDDLLLGG
ncbi:aerial mycelium formation protein [Streptacidiphilus sp. PB12-B1b]|uniref:RsiG family protein n=1 Tax=Streptacidiphilus sp. PB12-B1b TaxID=2705012 RepID=UPI003519EA36